MPSNKDLISEVGVLAEELGLVVTTEGLNNQALAALVSDLKAKKKDAETDTLADGAPLVGTDVDDDSNEDDAAVGPVIAAGKCLTSLKGILSEGMPVTPGHFQGGQETFDSLKKRGFIK